MNQQELWIKFENHLLNEGKSDRRIDKLKQMFNTCERGLNQEYSKCERKDIEKFVNNLNRDKFRKQDDEKYSGSVKSDIKKFLRQFFKWFRGNNEFYPPEVSWIKTRIKKEEKPKEKPVLSVKEVQKFANAFQKIELKMLVLLLFDSGFRIQEMLSVKKKDLTWEKYYENKKCFWIQCNVSKTLTRKVPIPLFTEDIQTYFNSYDFKSKKDNDPLFPLNYANVLKHLKKHSRKVFTDKLITPHCLRHSSATFYAREFDGNMNMIADRYGWSYSSDELKTYIRRSGAYQKAAAKKVFSNEVMKVKEENQQLRERMDDMTAQLQEIMYQLAKKREII